MKYEGTRGKAATLLTPALFALIVGGTNAHAAQSGHTAPSAARLVLAIQSAQTAAEGRRCSLVATATNNTGAGALNVQAAWTAQTEGFGIISDYQILGDFAAGETRSVRLTIDGAPCNAVRDLKLTRTVCVVGPAKTPPQSCADRVALEGMAAALARKDQNPARR